MRRDKNNMDHRYIELFLNSSPGGGGGGGGGGGFKPNRSFRNSYWADTTAGKVAGEMPEMLVDCGD